MADLVERAVLLSPGKELRVPVSELRDLSPTSLLTSSPTESPRYASPVSNALPAPTSISTMEEAERQHILRALRQTKWRIAGPSGAAYLLGMKRTTLQARMRKLGIRRPI